MRNTAAADWDGLRIHPQSFLETRNAHEVVYDAEQVEQVFAYKNFLLAVIDGELKWARARGEGDVEFQDFDPIVYPNATEKFHFQAIDNATGEYILMGNGTGRLTDGLGGLYVIDLTGVFDSENPEDPTWVHFYVPDPTNLDFVSRDEIQEDVVSDYHDDNHVEIYVQAVRTTKPEPGVPLFRDFTQPNVELPALQQTIAVSKAVSALGESGHVTVTFGDSEFPSSRELTVTELSGTSLVVIDTDNDPDTVKTVGGEKLYSVREGEIDVELFYEESPGESVSAALIFQASVGGESWIELGRKRSISTPTGQRTQVELDYNATTLGLLEADTVISFRMLIANNSSLNGEIVDGSIQIEAESAFAILTTSLENVPEDERDEYEDQPRTEFEFELNLPASNNTDYIDVYRSRRRDPPDAYESGYQWMARLPYEDGFQFTLKFPVTDDILIGTWIDQLPEQGDKVIWRYMDTDGVRAYAAPENSDKLYLSFFDNISERRYMNFTDVVNLPTAGEVITGVRFLRREYLVVYTARRIILVRTDPAAERCSVVDQLPTSPNDAAIGCFAPDSLASYSGYHLFLGPDKRVYRYGGQNVRWVGDKVEPLLIPLESEVPDDVSFRPANAVGAIHQGLYFLSFPSLLEDISHLVVWKGEPVEWDGGDGVADIEWKPGEFVPNTTLILDIERDRWYQDKFGITSFAKDHLDRLYGVVQGTLFLLYYVDADSNIRWRWKSNKFLLPRNMLLFNVFVYVQTAADMTVTLRTEQGEESQELSVADAFDYFSQYAGFALWGRTAEIEVTGTGPVTIDRIALNQEIE